jgi:1,4-alpha-glucan branching enzyme
MKQTLSFLVVVMASVVAYGQKVTLSPTITPSLFQYNSTITVTYDATGTSLASLTDAWLWTWIPNASIDAKYNINPATAAASAAKFTKSVANGKTTFSITFKPSDFFTQDISTRTSMGMLLKASDWSGGQTTDYVATFGFNLTLTAPTKNPLFVQTNQPVSIQAQAPVASEFNLYINDVLTDTKAGITAYSYSHIVTESSGTSTVRLSASSASGSAEVSFQYIISSLSPVASKPVGVVAGINYHPADASKVTLVLWAPFKTSAYVVGDFSDWKVLPQYLMKKDGEYFWIELSGLTPSQEYAFQYLVDETHWVAEPFADKILDMDDQFIPASTYPNLKTFPAKARKEQWYYNRLSVFQTAQVPYAWQTTNYQAPEKENLIVYEVLLRDFFGNGQRNYQSLIDTLSYLKNLGVNTIELMPVMEFNGNEGWGYNPTFMLAPDKYYGTKNKLKELVDKAHANGIAVVLDIAMNHHDVPNPFVMMYFDFVNFKPLTGNPWFNIEARHPFNVFFDMNHESAHTKIYLDSITNYWLTEYKVDGFRFDLSKGFTQKNTGSNVGTWSAKDDSRIALLKRMGDKIWSKHPEAILILEHFADNAEEIELSNHGFLLWGNMNDAYSRTLRGSNGGDLAGGFYKNRNWTRPNLVTYMESHDEERLMYNALTSGATSGSYSVRNLTTALERLKGLATFFYLQPGPKMLWQFGELGYDHSINLCEDGSVKSDCRLAPKPVTWNYRSVPERAAVHDHIKNILELRNTYPVFTSSSVTFSGGAGLLKQLTIKGEPYTSAPQTTEEMNVHIIGNFDITNKTIDASFPHTGTWYLVSSLFDVVQVNNVPTAIQLAPGEVRIYTDVPLGEITSVSEQSSLVEVYPNPATGSFEVKGVSDADTVTMIDAMGRPASLERMSTNTFRSSAAAGLYILVIANRHGTSTSTRLIRQ